MSVVIQWSPWRQHPWHVPRTPQVSRYWDESAHLLYTRPHTRNSTLRRELERLIRGAKKRVMVCSFLLGGEAIVRALVDAAQRLKGHVYVVVALDEQRLRKGLAQELDDETRLERTTPRFHALTRGGVYLRGADDCHAKFCVVDDEVAILGSANYDQNGLGEKDPLGELGVVVREPDRVSALAMLFRHLWAHGCGLEALPSPTHYGLSQLKRVRKDLAPRPLGVGSPIWTGFGSSSLLSEVQRLIESSKERLQIGTYSFCGMKKRPDLALDRLLAARKRGVEVELYLRSRSADVSELGVLVDAGVRIRGDAKNHAKYVIADGGEAALFSANFDGAHGLDSGVEAGVRLLEHEIQELRRYHEACWQEASTEVAWIREHRDLERLLGPVTVGWPGEGRNRIRLNGPRGALNLAEEICRSVCMVVGEPGGDESYLLVGAQRLVEMRHVEGAWEVREPDPNTGSRLTIAHVLARPGRYQRAWLPIDVEIGS